MKPNIIFYFSDQQRWDTLNDTLMPNVTALGEAGVRFDNMFTCQPVCGPARACLQTGTYATQNRCYWNGIPLAETTKTLAHYFNENGYDTAYIGKWHLASDRYPGRGLHCEKTAVPKSRQGGYKYWRAADVLEFTSHGYDGYVFDEDGKRIDFTGYRADCINDFALEYIEKHDSEKPFFMFVSQLEPHHQNDRHHFEGPRDTVERFSSYPIPDDLSFLNGDYNEEYPDYVASIHSLDENVGRLIAKLKQKGIYDDTIIIYTSDHGCHFKTRNAEYKRSCHDSCVHIPLVLGGGAIKKRKAQDCLVSLIDIPPTLLHLAGIKIPYSYAGTIIPYRDDTQLKERDCVFIQISESQIGRAVRTHKWKYSARGIGSGQMGHRASVYFDDFLYDLENDPCEKINLICDKPYKDILLQMRNLLIREMTNAGENKPIILPRKVVIKKDR